LAEARSRTIAAAGEKINLIEDYQQSKRTKADFMGLRKTVKNIE
jgi:hypothetical protein